MTPTPRNQLPYMAEPWFAVLLQACAGRRMASVARALGLSKGAISQVVNGTGRYGNGRASTARIAAKVVHVFDRFACPHLSSESAEGEVVITAAQCRRWALRPAPTSSPREMQHWQACRQCPHRQMAQALSQANAPAPHTGQSTPPIHQETSHASPSPNPND
ncbi:transcriptional regulator KorA [Vandammella animalimorsus]|uniref:transcriptional regulator KorA n=1 Tax=Vandammella animalimorsus TaxID=2029117 RepID=UPI001EECF8E6|nr:transcriptional regulator KorA [Vandammella animalimorsus]